MAYYKRLGAEDGVCVGCGYDARHHGKRLSGGFCGGCAQQYARMKAKHKRLAAAERRRNAASAA